LKRKTRSKNWKRLWFVLKDRAIYVYKAPEDNVAIEAIPILGYTFDLCSEVRVTFRNKSTEDKYSFFRLELILLKGMGQHSCSNSLILEVRAYCLKLRHRRSKKNGWMLWKTLWLWKQARRKHWIKILLQIICLQERF